jgi:hypothetical protein
MAPLAPIIPIPKEVEDSESTIEHGLGRKMIALIFCLGGSIFTSLFYIFGKMGHNKVAKADKDVNGLRIFC